MKTGQYKIAVIKQCGYLSSGIYTVDVMKTYVHFRNQVTGGATFETMNTLKMYIARGHLIMESI